MKKLIYASFLALTFLSCSQADETNTKISEESVSNTLKLSGTNTPSLHERRQPGAINVGIFEVTIHRASRGCTSGFGFCSFEWFPSPIEWPGLPPIDKNGQEFVWVYEYNGEYGFELYATEPISKEVDITTLTLTVDADVTAVGPMKKEFTIRKGQYLFDPTIGAYGGYDIVLTAN